MIVYSFIEQYTTYGFFWALIYLLGDDNDGRKDAIAKLKSVLVSRRDALHGKALDGDFSALQALRIKRLVM